MMEFLGFFTASISEVEVLDGPLSGWALMSARGSMVPSVSGPFRCLGPGGCSGMKSKLRTESPEVRLKTRWPGVGAWDGRGACDG